MIMALMLAIAMIMMAKQRCTSIVRTRGSQPATLSTKLKRQQHLLARHWPAAPQGIALPPRMALPCRPAKQPEWTETINAVCFNCSYPHQSCNVAYLHQCLMAQGWCKPQRNWYCAGCSEGLWKPPATNLVTCRHKHELLDRIATMAELLDNNREANRSSSWPPDRRTEVRDQRIASRARWGPRGFVRNLDQRIAEINAPLEDRPIGARLGPVPLPPPLAPPPLAQAADTARPLAAGPDPSFTPDETSILRAIAEETEDAGHRMKSWSEEQQTIAIRQCKFARDMEENGEHHVCFQTQNSDYTRHSLLKGKLRAWTSSW